MRTVGQDSVAGRRPGRIYRISGVGTEERRPIVRIGIVMLALAVVLCLVLPMTDSGGVMQLTMVCCFVLAVLLSLVMLIGPRWNASTDPAFGNPGFRAGRFVPLARAPDPIALGALLN